MEEGCPVYPLRVGSLVVIVSRLPEERFSPALLEKKLKEPAWLAQKARLHQAVVEAVMHQGPVVPMRLMTLFKTDGSLKKALLPHQAAFKGFLKYTRDKAEWALKVYLDKARARRYLLKGCKDPKGLTEKASGSPGGRYLLEKQRQRKAEEGLLGLASSASEDVSRRLSALSEDFKGLKPLHRSITSRPWDMLFNGAFLVADKTLKAFRKEVNSLARGYRQRGFIFHLSGPWPPYNFCPPLRKDKG